MPVTAAVEDLGGITHAVLITPDYGLAGSTACNARFWTVRLGTPDTFSLGRLQRMAETESPVDCMACLVGLAAYDEACTDGSPPTSETA